MNPKIFLLITLCTSIFGLCACKTISSSPNTERVEARWYNVKEFGGVDSIGTTIYDLVFDFTYSDINGEEIRVTNCQDTSSLGDSRIAEREFSRWDFLKTNCEAARRFYEAPDNAISYWPSTFDLALIESFPAKSVPYLGGNSLDRLEGTLAEHEPNLTLLEADEYRATVSDTEMVINYVVLARGDFNRDGYQDLFVRMDWRIPDTFGEGNDWVVLTKLAPNSAPFMLWRK